MRSASDGYRKDSFTSETNARTVTRLIGAECSEVAMGYVMTFIFGAWFGLTIAALLMVGDDEEKR